MPASDQPRPPAAADQTVIAPRWSVILAWSAAAAAAYALLGLIHAALVERILNLDVGFGRSLAFWIGALYVALPLWGFLPRAPTGWYARRAIVTTAALVGLLGLVVCGGFTVAWTVVHWNPSVGIPVLASLVVLGAAVGATLWFADREDRAEPTDEGR
ncbi:MAG TPA: hypothetical protein VEQ11_07285 [Chloroflexota bacterium]|nr:hypothetical protein [Chloroflexota bacterium]